MPERKRKRHPYRSCDLQARDLVGVAPFGIGYAFYDCEAEEDGGALAVLDNEEYNSQFAEVVDNLWDFSI